ncbi:DUF5455 family protein [Zhongshania marina]|uniref:Uncharacterized protein n=1 Tax=Zhongshania marina TaxID=2304603 RepID=A0ABX9W6D7_9GAMM|nr:hypothetical protein D0911_02945 [Zhongshania marina]
MAIPVLAGIPWLAGVIGGVFSALFAYIANFVTKRLAVSVAVVSVIIAVTTAFFVAVNAIVSGITIVAPPEVAIAAGLVVPSNATLCVSSYMSALLLRWAYQWNVKILQYKLF